MLKTIYQRFFTTRFKCPRKEYWLLLLFTFLSLAFQNIVLSVLENSPAEVSWIIFPILLYSILTVWVYIATIIRRLKDIGKSTLLVALLFVPLVNLVLIIWVGTQKSQDLRF